MKVLILSADSDSRISGVKGPRCLVQHIGKTSLLERQIRVLNLSGIKKENIFIVIGSQGVWKLKQHFEKVNSLGCNTIVNKFNSGSSSSKSLKLAIDKIGSLEPLLVIHGDLNFETSLIDRLINYKSKNIALTREALMVSENGIRLKVKKSKILEVSSDKVVNFFPWHIFCGMLLVQKKELKKYITGYTLSKKDSFFESIFKACNKSIFIAIDYSKPLSGINATNTTSIDLTGGSFASLSKRHLVRKNASGKGVKKLVDEIEWLNNIPKKLKNYFPTIVDFYKSNNLAWFDMPWYDLSNLRKNILLGNFGPQESALFIEKVLDFMFTNIYKNKIGNTPNNWVKEKHFNRVHFRLHSLCQKSPQIKKLILSDKIRLNNVEYENLPSIFYEMSCKPKLIKMLKPKDLRMIHGDLHFQNMLVGPTEKKLPFLLADPRGELKGSDIYYDLGKLWHSFNGLYDFIHTDQFSLELKYSSNNKLIKANLEFNNKETIKVYELIKKKVKKIITKYPFISNDSNWEIKTLLTEVMHFSSVMPFHLNKNKSHLRASALYLIATKLINEFKSKYSIDEWTNAKSLFNVENYKDYKKLIMNKKI